MSWSPMLAEKLKLRAPAWVSGGAHAVARVSALISAPVTSRFMLRCSLKPCDTVVIRVPEGAILRHGVQNGETLSARAAEEESNLARRAGQDAEPAALLAADPASTMAGAVS